MAGFARETPRVLQAIIQSNPVLIPNPPQYDSVNPKPVLDAHVKAIQLTVRKLKRQATTATLKLGLGVAVTGPQLRLSIRYCKGLNSVKG